MCPNGTTWSASPWASRIGPRYSRDRPCRVDVGDRVAARTQVHPGREPGQGIGDRVGDRQPGEVERLAREPVRIGRRRTWQRPPRPADPRRPRGWRRSRPWNARRWRRPSPPDGRAARRMPRPHRARTRRHSAAGPRPDWRRGRGHRSSGSGTRPRGGRARSEGFGRGRIPSRGRAPPPAPAPAASGDEPGRQLHVARADRGRLEWQPEVRRGDLRRVLARVPGPCAVGQRESVGEAERRRGNGRREPGSTDESHGARGRHGRPACQAGHSPGPAATWGPVH